MYARFISNNDIRHFICLEFKQTILIFLSFYIQIRKFKLFEWQGMLLVSKKYSIQSIL